MRLNEIARGEAWMNEEERQIMKRLVAAIRRLFRARGVGESPLLGMRVADVGVHCLIARRLELGLTPRVDEEGQVCQEISGAQADQIGKARERLRKAIRELEDACARLGTPVDQGLADQLLPAMRKTQDLLHNPEAALEEDQEA